MANSDSSQRTCPVCRMLNFLCDNPIHRALLGLERRVLLRVRRMLDERIERLSQESVGTSSPNEGESAKRVTVR